MPTASMATNSAMRRASRTLLRLLAALGQGVVALGAAMPASADGRAWPKYLHDNGGSGFAADSRLTAATAASLKAMPGWPVQLGATISTQPVLADGLIYVGAWDGYEYALKASGAIAWRVWVGITTEGSACQYPVGIAGAGAAATPPIPPPAGGGGGGGSSTR